MVIWCDREGSVATQKGWLNELWWRRLSSVEWFAQQHVPSKHIRIETRLLAVSINMVCETPICCHVVSVTGPRVVMIS